MKFDEHQACEQQQELESALALARRDGVSIMGAGGFARALRVACQGLSIKVHAFIVSSRTQVESEVDGLTIHAWDALPDDLLHFPLWIGIFNHHANAELTVLRKQCLALGFRDVRTPQEFFSWVAPAMGWRYWLAPLDGYRSQWPLIEQARSLLADDESRVVYDAIIGFRLGIVLDDAITLCAEQQYFPESLRRWMPASGCSYLDGGAYDGDTLRMAQLVLNPAQTYAFEPDPSNYQRLCAFTAGQASPVIQFPLGLSDAPAFLRFRSGQSDASSLDSDGDITIQVAALDELFRHTRIDFIKLDIEGSEIPALQGARQLIAKTLPPFLAIAGYHRWDDLWRIPLLINELSKNYKVVLKVHKSNSFEAVFYAYCQDHQ
jgi:FkbM family methyltransferase